ncbi:Transmembrane protein 87A [Hondaea fermentalgiana]|uniref:Transmembrane protein 87A n=1 Tax=Hondaea fermentalgiana TaxID=2315210 RepID=A0A2R5G4A6_9STRA|nr:Transmembrane protein 87A [Hondaea fermentalgiana]|eukprot:GBG25830.1 Transmembrane protein 87A [Hondaea fermentalgiana]
MAKTAAAVTWRRACWVALAVASVLCGRTEASIFSFENETLYNGYMVDFIKDMPMFSRKDSPSWIGGLTDPLIKVTLTVRPADSEDSLEDLFVDEDTGNVLIKVLHGWSDDSLSSDSRMQASCSDEAPSSFKDSEAWELTLQTDTDSDDDSGSREAHGSHTFAVTETGFHLILVYNCLGDDVLADITFEYLNPYGYLSGWTFGILPMSGFLCIGYAILAAIYLVLCLRNREHILGLQKAIMCVIIMGLVERFAQFLTYLEMNESGAKSCCPMRADLTFSSALSVLKRSSSALLLLAVCLGFGVVKPRLERSTNLKIFALGVVYTFSSLLLDFQRIADISKHGRPTEPLYFASLIVSVCDVIILFWIYFAMSEILYELREGQQIAKLGMYQRLARALAIWAFTWMIFTVLEVMVLQRSIEIEWRYWFVLVSFWDLFFLGILLQICYIWAPSPLTAQYAFSQQLPTTEDLDEFDQIGLEMQTPHTSADFVIDDDDDDLVASDDDDDSDGLGHRIGDDRVAKS